MPSYNFTDRVRKTLQLAREEATRLRHEYVGTEHILLGILREGEAVAAAVLADLNVNLQQLRTAVEASIKPGKSATAPGPDLPYTSHAKKVLEFAMEEASKLGEPFVGTEHLLLGVLHFDSSPAGQALRSVGVTLDKARASAKRLRSRERPFRSDAAVGPGDYAHTIAVPSQARLALLLAILALAVALVALITALTR